MKTATNPARILIALMTLIAILATAILPISAATYPTLYYGSCCYEAGLMQTMLNTVMDADIRIDEKFGTETRNLLRQFQHEYGLTVDGICGPKTWKKLIAVYEDCQSPTSTLSISSGKYPDDVLDEGESFSISGKISSNYKITRVTVAITPEGEDIPVISKTAKPNKISYNIKSLDSKIKFGKLEVGDYVFTVEAADKSGAEVCLIETAFRVESPYIQDSRFAQTKSKIVTYSYKRDGASYISDNFRIREFRCKDGSDKILIDLKLVALLSDIREYFGKPLVISSGYRTSTHNASNAVWGKPKSLHLTGQAADIYIPGVDPIEIARYAEQLGCLGIGYYPNSGVVHVDTRTVKFYWITSDKNPVRTFQ